MLYETSLGKAFLSNHIPSKVSCSVIIIQKYALGQISEEQAEQMNEEIEILLEKSHPHIARVIQVQETESNIYCINELLPIGSLESI